ncbi:rod-binding protein [Pleomorphomonas sp. NRK KF1]|uniref:rod-binding protein n=1 Tax=Pleomorphomonas sp. NRK KF1 TaxID=2943000 RepID=UPI00204333E6|nr:rod-binding protein [Pleomorphomonas sp. NRK KF1]MCM5552043.1 rod-binding protein [Pleomorphomonas sp. NRK KF1]
MAISPPSDIILDVARAADPERLKVATAKLDRLAETAGTAFADLMPAVSEAGGALVALAEATPTVDPSPSVPFDLHRARLRLQNETALAARVDGATVTAGDRQAKALESFEAMVLSTFIGSMLPEGAESVYGSGTAGDVWKSMLSDQLGRQMARAGGIGIADRLVPGQVANLDSGATSPSPLRLAALLSTVPRI